MESKDKKIKIIYKKMFELNSILKKVKNENKNN